MKKIFLIIIFVFSLGITANADSVIPYTEEEVANILYTQYPRLYQYYVEGVLVVKDIKPVVCHDGSTAYEVDYELTTYYYESWAEKLGVLKEYFPRLYYRQARGSITIGSVYKYVDTETGDVRYHATFKDNYNNRYYDYSPKLVKPTVAKPRKQK